MAAICADIFCYVPAVGMCLFAGPTYDRLEPYKDHASVELPNVAENWVDQIRLLADYNPATATYKPVRIMVDGLTKIVWRRIQ